DVIDGYGQGLTVALRRGEQELLGGSHGRLVKTLADSFDDLRRLDAAVSSDHELEQHFRLEPLRECFFGVLGLVKVHELWRDDDGLGRFGWRGVFERLCPRWRAHETQCD